MTRNTHTSNLPCRPDRTRQIAGLGGAATHTHQTYPAGQTALGRSPVREGQQHTHIKPTLPARPHSADRRSGRGSNTHTSNLPCRPDRTRQIAGQGWAATHTHQTYPADQTALGRSPVREGQQFDETEPQLMAAS